uniref:Glycine zipper domain-containing protein n=1 Tax=Solibacter usitatus (strain Ellin6076) TaxID=234267 RepID=Q026C6_SOLUE
MNFTPKFNVRTIFGGILTVAVVVLIAWISEVSPATRPTVARHDAFQSFQTGNPALVVPAVELGQTSGYQPIAWYKNKSWWKRNAPIVGGAGGGALVGGLLGGGKGALIGGAVGGGGGYLYKRYRHSHSHPHYHSAPAPATTMHRTYQPR